MPPHKSPSYVQTQLPVLLDLQNRNTRDQLSSGISRASANTVSVAEQSRADCESIMEQSAREWMDKKKLRPPFSRENDYKYFWEWVKEFHNEYNEDWFMRNMPRLKTEFQPSWTRICKEVKQASSQPNLLNGGNDLLGDNDLLGGTETTTDLLDVGGGTPSTQQKNSTVDLLGGRNALSDTKTAAQASSQGQGNLKGQGNDLLDLLGDGPSEGTQPASSMQPMAPRTAPVVANGKPAGGDLLDLLGGGTPSSNQTTALPAPGFTGPLKGGRMDELLSMGTMASSTPMTTMPPNKPQPDINSLSDELLSLSINNPPAASNGLTGTTPIMNGDIDSGVGMKNNNLAASSPVKTSLAANLDSFGDLLAGVSFGDNVAAKTAGSGGPPKNSSLSPKNSPKNSPKSPVNATAKDPFVDLF